MTEQLATIYDETTPPGKSANGASTASSASAYRAAAQEMKTAAANIADQATTKAKEAYRQTRVMAEQRAEQARTAIVERPWAAVGVIFLAGMVLGRAILGGGSPRVIYLRDRG